MSEQNQQIAKILEQIALWELADADQLLAAIRDEKNSEIALRQIF